MESLIERQGNIQIATGGSAQSWTASWTHPGSSYTLESIALRFTLDSQTSNGYSVRVTEVLGPGNYSDRANKAEWKAAGTTVTVPLNSLAWEGKTSGTLTAVFMRRTNYYVCYTSIAFVLTYRSIADPSQVVVITTDAGAPQTVNITNTDPDVYHVVRWQYALDEQTPIDSGELTYNAATRSPAWAVPQASLPTLYAANTHSATETGTVTVKTYTVDDQLVGTTTADAVLYLPETTDTRPVVQFVSENDTMDAVAAAIEASTGNAYVQNHTTVKRTITAQGYQGAGIAQVQVVTPDGVATGANSTQIEQLIRTAGTYAIEYHIIDTRGQTLVVTGGTETVQAYTDPTITSIQGLRCDQNGNAKEDGTYIWVEASAIVNTGSTATYTAKLFVKNGSQIGSAVTLANGAGILGGSLDENTSYTVKVTVTDSYGVEDEEEVEIGTGTITFSRMAGGKGAAFGKLAEKYGVEIAETWPLYVHGAEILRLIIDLAHPIGSCIESLDNGWDPNTAWPWTAWSKDAGKWWRGV